MSEAAEMQGLRVLVVEDEMLVAMMIEDILEDLGCETTMAGSKTAGLAALQNGSFDAAVLDVNLHGETSYPVAKAAHDKGIPVLFSTGYSDTRLGPPFENHPILTKPFGVHDLTQALSWLTGGGSG
ncbi:response regulator [Cribrihabitans neustonicus]|uniref:response regulator n=1 Tax=Cribrihabitans neustonicus TaxID=1429085 RepID=UPI003B5B4752